MATRFSNTIRASNGTNANFQAWAQFVEDTLVTTGGWVVTADTGQTLPSALVATTAGNQKRGFRIYRMADSLQATSPVFMRIDFGSGTSSVIGPGMWLTIGTGSDGAGNITGVLMASGSNALIATGIEQAATACNSYASAGPARVALLLFVQAVTASLPMALMIERSKDASGNDTGDGLLLIYTSNGGNGIVDTSRYVICTVGTQPSAEQGLNYVITMKNPTETLGGDVGAGLPIHFKGAAQQPGANMVIVNSNDVGAEGGFVLSLYGATKTYQAANVYPKVSKSLVANVTTDTNCRPCIRYD